MSKSVTSDQRVVFATFVWRLALTLWLGSALALPLLVLPGLSEIGFAPMLAEELMRSLGRSQGALTLGCAGIQLLILARKFGCGKLIRDVRGMLLIGAAVAGACMYFGLAHAAIEAERMIGIVLAALGLLLLGRPAPYRA